ncbi:enoyl-CoA hydratase-related protein [Bradyrhizobium sp. 142]|uniref:enoyl-CoA hydratase-related protein n=1 Tax=Bradyrhizobium sp. 142 TaxID=2782618 RepID=UPI0020968CC3|nr:enoyl-CoA hydratase-related protein [Bradyrhizobium sp. 142]
MNEPSERILTERRGPIVIITINRPEARNAFDRETSNAMNAAMGLLDEDDGLFIGVITGAGGNFSAGADLKEIAKLGVPPRSPVAASASWGVLRENLSSLLLKATL